MRADLFTDRDRARFWVKVDRRGPDECWPWTAGRNTEGYGHFRWNSSVHTAHRCAFALERGDIDPEQVVDHLCRNRACCNPAHLESVTHRINVQRGVPRASKITRCPSNHAYDEANTGWYEHPRTGERERFCRACKREKRAESRQDPEVRRKDRAYARSYQQRPKAQQLARESAARYRASWTPEQREAKLEYLREYRRRKKMEAGGS